VICHRCGEHPLTSRQHVSERECLADALQKLDAFRHSLDERAVLIAYFLRNTSAHVEAAQQAERVLTGIAGGRV